MVAKLCFDRPLNRAYVGTEYNLVKLLDHHSRAELTKVATLLAGRSGRMLLCQITEVGTPGNVVFKRLTLFFRINQYMSCRCFGHILVPHNFDCPDYGLICQEMKPEISL